MRFKLLKGKPSTTEPGAFVMRINIIKNKCAQPWGGDPIEFPFYYGKGTDEIMEVLEMARTLGFLRHSAGQSKWRLDLKTEVWEAVHPEMEKGKEACIEFFRTNPVELEILRTAMEANRVRDVVSS